MKLKFNRFSKTSETIVILLIMILSMFPVLVQADLEAELRALREQMEAVHLELAEQGAMIRALYDYVDAEIGLEAVQQETRDDGRLRIEPLTQINDANLTHIAIANPGGSHDLSPFTEARTKDQRKARALPTRTLAH